MNKALLTLRETADYLSMGESTITMRVRNETFPAPVWVGSNKYWRKKDLDLWIENLPTTKYEARKETRGRKRLAVV